MRQTPQRIISDEFIRVVFDYVDFHITVSPEDYIAASQVEYDEVIKADFRHVNSAFKPHEFANLIEAGIMLKIERQLSMCFSCHNCFGIVGSIMSPDEIKEDVMPFYELIEIV